nr:retrotransposon Gag protein [Tanacetum cinerariifolium]
SQHTLEVVPYLDTTPNRVVSVGAFIKIPRCGLPSDRDAEDALSKLLQIGTVTECQDEFEMLINRVTGISESLLTSFYISRLKVALQIEVLRAGATTLGEAFSLACITKTRFKDERSASAITKPNVLNTRVHVQDLDETTRHKPNKMEAIKSSGSSSLVE